MLGRDSIESLFAQGDRFLFQHSTGAGKTMTIAAVVKISESVHPYAFPVLTGLLLGLQAHQLLLVRDPTGLRFHTIVVVLDRVKLNEQVGDAVERYLRRNGIDEIFRAESIQHLSALLDGTHIRTPQRVIVTTIHKMGLLAREPVLLERLLHRQHLRSEADDCAVDAAVESFQRVAILTDEAHRSHSAATRKAIERVMSTSAVAQPTVSDLHQCYRD